MKRDSAYCNTFKNASDEWNREVDAEAARLVEEGTPPYEAVKRATEAVSRRRRQQRDKTKEPTS